MSYRAPFGCPSPEQFVSSIENRSALLEPELGPSGIDPGDHVRAEIRADPAGPGWIGTILIEGSSALERAVRGEHCEDVASALALIAVLRLEPEHAPAASASDATNPASSHSSSSAGTSAETAPASAAATPSTATPTGPVGGSSASTASPAPTTSSAPIPPAGTQPADGTAAAPTTSAPTTSAPTTSAPTTFAAPTPNESTPPLLPPSDAEPAAATDGSAASPAPDRRSGPETLPPTASQPERESSSESSPSTAQTEPGAASAVSEPHTNGGSALAGSPRPLLLSLTAAAGYAAAPAPSFEVALGAELRFGAPIESWVAAASLLYRQGSRSSASGDLSLRLIGAELAACPVAFRMGAHVWARVCAELDAGLLAASVSQRALPIEADDTLRPWLSLGPSLQFGIPLGTRFSLRLLAQGEAVLIRDHFDVARIDSSADVILYRSPALAGSLLLGIGYTF